MQTDPVLEWQRLTVEYRQMSAEELFELARDYADLTETAQQVLRSEMRSRGLDDPAAPEAGFPSASELQQSRSVPRKNFDLLAGPLANSYVVPTDPAEQDKEDSQEDDSPADYTWKTLLCECNEPIEARHISAVLTKAGIDNWVEWIPGYGIGIGNPRVLVAADQLDRAREIAARPIPQEIIEESNEEVPEFVEPKCPKCGSDDVVLEGVDQENRWRCEECETEWSDVAEGGDGGAGSTDISPS